MIDEQGRRMLDAVRRLSPFPGATLEPSIYPGGKMTCALVLDAVGAARLAKTVAAPGWITRYDLRGTGNHWHPMPDDWFDPHSERSVEYLANAAIGLASRWPKRVFDDVWKVEDRIQKTIASHLRTGGGWSVALSGVIVEEEVMLAAVRAVKARDGAMFEKHLRTVARQHRCALVSWTWSPGRLDVVLEGPVQDYEFRKIRASAATEIEDYLGEEWAYYFPVNYQVEVRHFPW